MKQVRHTPWTAHCRAAEPKDSNLMKRTLGCSCSHTWIPSATDGQPRRRRSQNSGLNNGHDDHDEKSDSSAFDSIARSHGWVQERTFKTTNPSPWIQRRRGGVVFQSRCGRHPDEGWIRLGQGFAQKPLWPPGYAIGTNYRTESAFHQ